MKDKIICLVGESGSGKSTIAEALEKEGYNYIESYTTRPPRYEGERGHIFLDSNIETAKKLIWEKRIERFPRLPICHYWLKSNIIAYTFFNNSHYWATKEQYQGKGTSIYVVDVAGAKMLKEKINDAEIVVIYLKTDTQVRYKRMCKTRLASDAAERIVHDNEKFKLAPCDFVVDANGTVEETLELIRRII